MYIYIYIYVCVSGYIPLTTVILSFNELYVLTFQRVK